MASMEVGINKEREGAEVVYGSEECHKHSMELLEELGFPPGILPLKNLEECGRVRDTGFVWLKQSSPSEHYFKGIRTLVYYAKEVTAFVEKNRMKRMTGIKSKEFLFQVPLAEMSIQSSEKIYFKSNLGIGRSLPLSAFQEEGTQSIHM